MLHAPGFEIETYHLNEGHAALLALSLLRRQPPGRSADPLRYDVDRVWERCVFTTHTPVAAGHDRFGYEEVVRILGDYVELDQLKLLAGAESLNMTSLALNLSGYVNGVARRHAETAQQLYPGYRIKAVTNGVHAGTWAQASFARLFDTMLPNWAHEPEVLTRADQLAADAVWAAHQAAKRELLAEVEHAVGKKLQVDVPVIGFARRMTGYKRPDLLFTDVERLRAIARAAPFQLVLAGKAHPRDEPGKQLIQRLHGHIRELAGEVPMVFLPNHDMALARKLVAGVDVWLNTPLPPLEASGTSGMKAALNSVLNRSVLDGWWLEACIEGVTGWAIGRDGGTDGDHARALYDKLERAVLPLYRDDRDRWVWMMKQAISKIGGFFNSQRMIRRYASEAYLR
jgi:starch phosphorylase